MRDISGYAKEYLKPGFENEQVKYRRRKILEFLEKGEITTKRIIEIGCGTSPFFEYFDKFDKYVFFEPSKDFFLMAENARNNDERIIGFNEPFCVKNELLDYYPDVILCSGLLHEVEDPRALLEDIVRASHGNTVIHINVPNANSFHRVLAKAMGIIRDVKEMSELNMLFQQNRVFDIKELVRLVEETGLKVVEKGSYFIKPFTHSQMWEMLNVGIITEETLDGLYTMGECDFGMGSEIYVNCKL